jgi:hypothetical protein
VEDRLNRIVSGRQLAQIVNWVADTGVVQRFGLSRGEAKNVAGDHGRSVGAGLSDRSPRLARVRLAHDNEEAAIFRSGKKPRRDSDIESQGRVQLVVSAL